MTRKTGKNQQYHLQLKLAKLRKKSLNKHADLMHKYIHLKNENAILRSKISILESKIREII